MSTWAILATGPSMSQEIADYVRGKTGVIAVSNSYLLAPWADALVSNDAAWWKAHPEAFKFKGRKFAGAKVEGTELIKRDAHFGGGCNSGFQAMRVANDVLGATKIVLLGLDMQGSHFFGDHKPPLKNTVPARFEVHKRQFEKWNGCEVINCTPGSALKAFPMGELEEVIK